MELALAEQEATHKREFHQANPVNPHWGAMRHHVEQIIVRFQSIEARASAGAAIQANDIYSVESEARHYLSQNLPEYRNFGSDYPIPSSYIGGTVMQAQEAIHRCQARIIRLREVLAMLQLRD